MSQQNEIKLRNILTYLVTNHPEAAKGVEELLEKGDTTSQFKNISSLLEGKPRKSSANDGTAKAKYVAAIVAQDKTNKGIKTKALVSAAHNCNKGDDAWPDAYKETTRWLTTQKNSRKGVVDPVPVEKNGKPVLDNEGKPEYIEATFRLNEAGLEYAKTLKS